jgi:hypothetical protein
METQNPQNEQGSETKTADQLAAEASAAENAAASAAAGGEGSASAAANSEGETPKGDEATKGAEASEGTKGEGEAAASETADETDGVEWHQKRTGAAAAKPSENPDDGAGKDSEKTVPVAEYEAVKSELEQSKVRIQELEGQVAQLESAKVAMADPVVEAWVAHKLALGENADPTSFLKELGEINEVSALNDEEKVRLYYENEAKELGLTGEKLQQAVEEKVLSFQNMLTLDQTKELKQAESALKGKKATSVADIKQKYIDKMKAEEQARNNELLQTAKWVKTQFDLTTDYVNKLVEKGKFNGRTVDRAWADRVMDKLKNSPLFTDPDFLPLADPDEKGVQNVYVPELVENIDALLHHREIFSLLKKEKASARVENLDERARNVEQKKIDEERAGLTAKELEDRKFQAALDAQKKGKVVPA